MFHTENIQYSPCTICITNCIVPSFHCKPNPDAPSPSEIAEYTIYYYNDMGHLGSHYSPEIAEKYIMTISNQTSYYTLKSIEQYTKIINNYIYNYFRLRKDAPNKENVVIKMDNNWVTVCLDYTGIEPSVESTSEPSVAPS
jgi:hypothetical protein